MRQLIGFLFLILLSCISVSAISSSRGIDLEVAPIDTIGNNQYFALIIGNAEYRDVNDIWHPLKTSVKGAKSLADMLRSRYSFTDVTILENSTRKEIIMALSTLNDKVGIGDNVLVYYAGHGFLDVNGLGYWVPVDAIGGDKTTYIRNSTIRDEVSVIARRAHHTLLISDSCFSGSLLGVASRGAKPENADQRYYQQLSQKRSVQIITAGGNEFVDDDYKSTGYSPFTHFLLNELKFNNAIRLSATELAHQIRKAVSSNVAQTPASGVLQGAGDELGEFIFLNVMIPIQVEISNNKAKSILNNSEPVDFNELIRKRLPIPIF